VAGSKFGGVTSASHRAHWLPEAAPADWAIAGSGAENSAAAVTTKWRLVNIGQNSVLNVQACSRRN
jgi:hypothetical protein